MKLLKLFKRKHVKRIGQHLPAPNVRTINFVDTWNQEAKQYHSPTQGLK